ncbi:MAG: hypothetical protein KC619_02755 [Myxococcales bacterium]|nr:hypothetical protein [Myxococcales bacterium]
MLPPGLASLAGSGAGGGRLDPYGCDGGDGGGGDGPDLLDSDGDSVPDILSTFVVTARTDLVDAGWSLHPLVGTSLGLRLPADARWSMVTPFDTLFLPGHATAEYDLRFIPLVCDEDRDRDGTVEADERCRTDGQVAFEGFRQGLVDARSSRDAAYPRQQLEVGSFVETASVDAEQRFNVLSCPLTIAGLGPQLELLVHALPTLEDFPGAGSITFPGAGFIICELIADAAEDAIAHQLACADRQIDQLLSILVNPPLFRVSMDEALIRTGADMDGNGRLSATEVSGTLTAPPFMLPSDVALGLSDASVRSLIDVNIQATGNVDPSAFPAIPAVPLTGDGGALRDEAVVVFARGGTIDFTGATVDLRGLRDACELGRSSSLLCGACAPGGPCTGPGATCADLCVDGHLVDDVTFALPSGTVTPIVVPPLPTIAEILGGAPLFAESIRRLFSNAIPAGGRYTALLGINFPFSNPTVTFQYRVDPDGDHLDSFTVDPVRGAPPDSCPYTYDPTNADDGDGDIFGAACDACPGVVSTCTAHETCSDAGDPDDDGLPNGCDCDRDGDLCFNAGEELGASGAIACSETRPGRGFDTRPSLASTLDFSGNGIPDDCDLDFDSDGVPNDVDNCPLGDGDDLFEPLVDTNPVQLNSGGAELGDLCDPLCPGPGAPGCDIGAPGGGGGGGGAGGSFPDIDSLILRAGIPIGGCLDDSPSCDLLWILECASARIGDCFGGGGFDLVLRSVLGQELIRLDAASIGLDAGFAENLAAFPDLDGDGLPELVLSAPGASFCTPNQSMCVPAAGQVLLVSSVSGNVVQRFGFPIAGGLGASLAVSGRTIAVGAPEALDDQGRMVGALYLFRQEAQGFRLAKTVFGEQVGEGFGTSVSAVPGRSASATFLVAAPNADHPGRPGAGAIRVVDEVAGMTSSLPGPIRHGHLERGLGIRDALGRLHILGLMPEAGGGDGAVVVFRDGASHRVVRGGAGALLGADAAVVPTGLGSGRFVVATPGANGGRGGLLQLDLDGREVARSFYAGESFGVGMAVIGDTNGDGIDDLAVGLDYGTPAVAIVTRLDPPEDPCRGRGHCPRHP